LLIFESFDLSQRERDGVVLGQLVEAKEELSAEFGLFELLVGVLPFGDGERPFAIGVKVPLERVGGTGR
jgi:hypothetical protein